MLALKVGINELFSSERLFETNSLKNSIFEIYSKLYHLKTLEEKSTFKIKVIETLSGIILCFQMLSFLWSRNLSISNWSDNMILWEIIGYFRLDNICSEFGIIRECLYLSITTTFMLGTIIIYLVISTYFSLSIFKLFDIFRLVFDVWLTIFLMPSMILYSVFLKYSIWPQKYISEYKNGNHIEDFEISTRLQIVIVLALAIDFHLLYFYTQFSSEIRHSESSKTIKAKAHSKIDSHIAIFTYFSPIFYAILNEKYIIYFQFFAMITSIIVMIESEILLPYFSLYFSLTRIFQLFTIALASSGFVLGYWMDNWLVIIFILIILGPISAIFVIQFTIKRQRQINTVALTSMEDISSKYELEKRLRYWLCCNSIEHKDEIIHTFENYFLKNNSHEDKLPIIWLANYCFFTLKDEPLAKVKLSKTKTISSWNLEAEFQKYLCNKNINEPTSNESLQLINYYQQLNLLKKKDSKLCIYLLKFWEELTATKPNLRRLINKLKWIDENILYLNNQYKQLIVEFLDSREGLMLYTTYAKDVVYDYEKSNLLEIKLRGLTGQSTSNSDLKRFSFLNDSSGILIISGEPDDFGRVLFSNPKSAEILKTSIGSLEESNIIDFFHNYYYDSLKEEMKWLIHYGSSSEIDLGKGFFLNIPGKYLLSCTGKAVITSIGNNLAFILNFQLKQIKREFALLSETGEILCCSEYFSHLIEKSNENLIGYNIKDLFSDAEMHESTLIFQSKNKETILVISHTQFYKIKVFYATLMNDYEEIQRWKNKNNHHYSKIREKMHKHHLSHDEHAKGSAKTYQKSDEKYLNSEIKLIETNPYEASEAFEKNSVSKSSDAKSQITSERKFFKMIKISSRSINVLHFAFILSIIAVLTTNIVVLFYAFSYIGFIKNMDFPMAIAQAESRLQIAAFTAQLLWVLTLYEDPTVKNDILAVQTLLPGYINDVRDIYMDIAANLPKWNYCSSKSILTDKSINVWNLGQIKRESLFDMLSQSAQQGYDLLRKYNNSEDYTNEIRFLKMNGYGDGFQYINKSLYEIMDCQKSLMLDFKSEVFVLLILGIGVLGLCLIVMIPFCYSVVTIENNFWNNLRKKAFQNYSEMKQTLLERLRNIHAQPDILSSSKNPSKKIFSFKNYWKYIWRICIYFIIVTGFSLINITYLYENCSNYLTYRPEVIRELIRTKILINTFIIAASDLQYYVLGFPLDYLFNTHNYKNSFAIFEQSVVSIGDSRLTLRNPKYSPILSNDFKKAYYKSDSQPYTHYLDYGGYAAEEELINAGYQVASINVNNDATYRNWIYNMTLFRKNYDKYVDEINNYSQSVIEHQMNIIIAAFSIFVVASIIIYFILYFLFFKNEKKYLQKINSMIKFMPV
ncbi:unnamed protein product [Blepharisma stoltei]|uniref:TmcB/TmcC TPR repeats domain-containing protein n=1 Tax=Blepharisma stoltei TaxID=1481888 RepID=A0AAU9IJ69_9CILI|nr:unnamed protein product [Blepharisma stoltei]